MSLDTLYPEQLWKHFETICSIPHPSKHEEKLRAEIQSIAEQANCEVIIDTIGNIIVKKNAHPESITTTSIALQAHIDMVPQKNNDCSHNFETDPIVPYIDKDWVTATDTTLGADNGIGAAAMLALITSTDIKHGPLEFLFTVDEEAGMGGAFGLEPGVLQSKYMLNLDSEDDRDIIIGCAGGIDVTISDSLQQVNTTILEARTYEIALTGLRGGHSGIDIDQGRANANIQLCECLLELFGSISLDLISFNGGNMRNAIPREAYAKVAISDWNEAKLVAKVEELEASLKKLYASTEPNLQLNCKKIDVVKDVKVFPKSDATDFCKSVANAPNGVINHEPYFPDVVQTSTNLSIAELNGDILRICALMRSSCDDAKTDMVISMREHFQDFSYNATFDGEYPGWTPVSESKILKKLKKSYNAIMKNEPAIKIIHAGLECGIIGSKYTSMEMVSFGPTIKHPHSPDEKVNIKSVGKFWDVLTHTLENY